MENPELTQTPAEPMNTDDVLEIASTEDLKYLAAIGLRALAAYEAAGDNEIDGGDYLQTVGQAVHEATAHAPRPQFLPTAEEIETTDGEVWRDRFDPWLWNIG